MNTQTIKEDRLKQLGFTSVANEVKEAKELARKVAIAKEFYRYVTDDNVTKFNDKLFQIRENDYTYKRLNFTPISAYKDCPPNHVLDSLETAISRKCFDGFEVAHIVNVEDPILFGVINGCTDKFFIDQWDDDVKIFDIIKENEG